MILYDVHTHKIKENQSDYKIRSIMNISPEDISAYPDPDDVWFSCGIHPWNSFHSDKYFDLLRSVVSNEKLVAIGEIGLDKLKGPEINIQIEMLRKQIELAAQMDLPIIIHCVKAWDELIALYKEYKTSVPWIIHGFRGNIEQAKQMARLGFKFSIGEKFNPEAVRCMAIDSIFCETDMSDISIRKVYEDISAVLGLEFDQIVSNVECNIGACFNKISK